MTKFRAVLRQLREAVFDELYERLKLAVEDAGIETEVELTKGDGYTFVRFRDTIFLMGTVR